MAKPLKKFRKRLFKSPFVIWLASWLIYWYMKFIKSTIKWETEGVEEVFKWLDEGKSGIALAWHGRIVMMPPVWPKRHPMKALVSQHQDGRLIAKFLNHFGIETINGSTTSNAKGSALQLMKALKNGSPIAIIPDGPRGPRQKMSQSPVYFAQKTGSPIFLITYSIKNCKIIEKSWDKMLLPRPFSKGIFLVSEPIYIPQDVPEKDLEKYRLMVETKLNDMQNKADDYTGSPRISQGESIKKKRNA
jgi:lysophospholipid acyltransferase (LPLAT)-like uncharacterized protein